MHNYKRRAISGVFWSAIERYSVQGIQFIVSIILARLLTPIDFGLVAIVIIFTTIFQTINESGLNTALIHKQDRDNIDFSTAFYANVGIGCVSYLIIFFITPLIAKFYNEPSLIRVMRILSLTLVINSFGIVQNAKFTINLDFKTQAKASFTAALISGIVGILVAIIYRNVYSIVIQSLTYSIFYVNLMWLFSKWKPLFLFSYNRLKFLLNYAYKLIFARVINIVFEDIYSLAIGKLYSPQQLGFYNRANSFRQVLSKDIISTVQRVSIPLLCEKQKNQEQMKNVLKRFIITTAVFVYPLLAGLMILGKPLVLVLLGEKWLPTAEILVYVCPIGFFYLISTFNRNIYNATGRTDWALKAEIIKKIFFIGIFFLTYKYEMKILLIGLVFISIFEMLYDVYYSKKQIGFSLWEQFKELLSVIIATIVMSLSILLILHFLRSSSSIFQLFVGLIIGMLVYGLICYILNIADIRIWIIKLLNKIRS